MQNFFIVKFHLKFTSMRFLIVFCVYFAFSWTQEVEEIYENIVGGHLIEISQAPYMAQLMMSAGDGNKYCGGTIILPNVILSSAQCVLNVTAKDIMVRVGTKYFNRGGNIHRVKSFIVHPSYNRPLGDFDVSLLLLALPISLKPKVKEIIELSARNETVEDGTFGFVCGSGETINEKDDPQLLRGVVIPTTSQKTCQSAYPSISTKNRFCAGFNIGDRRTCLGDSGGGFLNLITNKIIGVISFSHRSCIIPFKPLVMIRISSVRDWIDSTLRKFNFAIKSDERLDFSRTKHSTLNENE